MPSPSVTLRTGLAVVLISATAQAAVAAEGAVSHYAPGLQAALGFGLPPARGLTITNVLWRQSGETDRAVMAEGVYEDVERDAVINYVAATYGTDYTILGGTYSAGVIVPFGRVSVSGDRRGGGYEDESAFGLGDVEVIPLQLNWSRGNLHFKLSQSVTLPVGSYDEDDIANVGRNHWSFDTLGAVTWVVPQTGTEVSAALGLMHNAENTATEYNGANESHFDVAISQRVTDEFAISAHYYRLNQLKSDKGEGVISGTEDFSRGVGAGFTWSPHSTPGVSLSGLYMHDYETRNHRLEADYAQLALNWTF